jgi:hypothetical protein
MPKGSIFLIQEKEGRLVEMKEEAYEREDLLQKLLADYPNLLAGDQINSTEPRRWLLIKREMPVPSEEDGADRWSVDHLFLDQEAIPTLVEVKRSTDSRIRREVVGQMLDYAANGVIYWPLEKIRATFEASCETSGEDPQEKLQELLQSDKDSDPDQEKFWENVKINLKAGKIRMIFVADMIPDELRRIVEFLSEQMDPAEVFAIEIKQFEGQGLKTLVPRVIGNVTQTTSTPPARKGDEPSFFETLKQKSPDTEPIMRKIFEWAKARTSDIRFGQGAVFSFSPFFKHNDLELRLIKGWNNGGITIELGYLRKQSPFGDEAKRIQLLDRLHSILGISLQDAPSKKSASFDALLLGNDIALNQFLQALDWALEQMMKAV